MEILLTGYTAFLTQEWIETAFPDDHVLTTHTKSEALLDTRVKTVTLDGKQLLAQINETYQFDRIVYFSEYLLPHGEQEGELDRLRWVLQACREREVQLLYFSGPMAALTPPSGKSLLANAAEELCFHYAKTSKIQVKVFRLPYLYAVSESGTEQFARLFEQMPTGTVQMDEQAAQPLLALCMEELADLTARVFDTWTPEPERFLLPQVFDATQRQVGEVLQKLQPGLEVCYGADTLQTYPTDDRTVRRRYGWFQRYSLLDDLPAIYKLWQTRQAEKKEHRPPRHGQTPPEHPAAPHRGDISRMAPLGSAGTGHRHRRPVPDDRFPADVRHAHRHGVRPQRGCAGCRAGLRLAGGRVSAAGDNPDAAVL